MVGDSWTDERLDDLNDKVGELGRRMDNGFNRVDADLRGLRTELCGEMGAMRTELRGKMGAMQTGLRGEMGAMRIELRGEIGELRGEMNDRFKAIDARFDALQHTLFQFGGVMVAALIGVIATLIATQI